MIVKAILISDTSEALICSGEDLQVEMSCAPTTSIKVFKLFILVKVSHETSPHIRTSRKKIGCLMRTYVNATN